MNPPALAAARDLLTAGRYAEAADAIVPALADPAHGGEARVIRAVSLLASGQLPAALDFLDTVSEPGWPDFLRAVLAAGQGDDALARHFLRPAVEADPSLSHFGHPKRRRRNGRPPSGAASANWE